MSSLYNTSRTASTGSTISMNMKKERHKLKPSEELKIRLRFQNKCKEFNEKTVEELEELYNKTKMSGTDRRALLYIASIKKKINVEVVNKTVEEADGN